MNKLLSISLCNIDMAEDNGGRIDNKDGITYNDGKGIKDTIVMTGPLSNIFTQALNIYFQKKTLEVKPVEEEESASVAVESAMLHSMLASGSMIDGNNNFNFVDSSTEFEETPKAIIYATTPDKSNTVDEIEVIQADYDRYKDTDKDWVLFISTDESGKSEETVINTGEEGSEDNLNPLEGNSEFTRVTENIFTSIGIPTVVGLENLKIWLDNNLTKD